MGCSHPRRGDLPHQQGPGQTIKESPKNRKRIAEAIKVLKKVHEDNLSFDYENWGWQDSHSCQTVACAGGYLALHEPFNKQGLLPKSKNCLNPRYHDFYGSEALAAFFEISWEAASTIFVFAAEMGTLVNIPKELPLLHKNCPSQITALDIATLLQALLDHT